MEFFIKANFKSITVCLGVTELRYLRSMRYWQLKSEVIVHPLVLKEERNSLYSFILVYVKNKVVACIFLETNHNK